jgi:transcriptional regulator with XRE-family HTH domain
LAQPISFGAVLRAYRAKEGLSQYGLAARVDVDPSMVHRLEHGQRNASRTMIERFVERLALKRREANVWRLAAGFAPR